MALPESGNVKITMKEKAIRGACDPAVGRNARVKLHGTGNADLIYSNKTFLYQSLLWYGQYLKNREMSGCMQEGCSAFSTA